MNTVHERAVPYVTVREGEEAAAHAHLPLRTAFTRSDSGVMCLGYWDEEPENRDMHDVLWTRTSQSLGQREDMLKLKCQDCGQAARTPEGLLFPVSKENGMPSATSAGIHTDQPPVCRQHAAAAAKSNPELVEHGYVPVRAQRARMCGVIGTPYILTTDGFEALEPPTRPSPTGIPSCTGSRPPGSSALLSFTVIDLAQAQEGDR
ncbi:hypothetical protein ACFVYR_35990 [Streptomyces sp. NPDC058284]|uniref:hypothetical protein n=1 Tax=unclassified Streptomyces TaxID=2593676 RepID=UPI00365F4597